MPSSRSPGISTSPNVVASSVKLLAGNDLTIGSGAQWTVQNGGAIVADNATPPSELGSGGIKIAADAKLDVAFGGACSFYSSRRPENAIDPTVRIAGLAFEPGPENVHSAREVWGTPYPGGVATPPFTFLYREGTPPPPPPGSDPGSSAPDTKLVKKPAKKKLKLKGKKKRVKVAFKFESTIPGSRFTCTLDGKASRAPRPSRRR